MSSLLRWSLKRTVLTLLLPTLVTIAAFETTTTYRATVDAANSAYDRSLLGAIKAIDANISSAGGGISVEMPYTLLEFFEMTASGEVFFRVATEDGLVEIGSPELPSPPVRLASRKPQFYDADYLGQKLRVGAYARNLGPPSAPGGGQRIIIQVAESLTSRQAFINNLLAQAASRDILLLLAAGGVLAIVLVLILRPLARLSEQVRARSPEDMTPIDVESVPADVRPLVDAINLHMARNRQVLEGRRRFIDDASHQLRTPLTTLRTQLDYVLRESDPRNVREALTAVSRQLDDATHRTNQMLSLGKADSAELSISLLDLRQLAEDAAREVVVPAREKQIDLEFSGPDKPVLMQGHAGLLREAALNLLHNAIRFAPARGQVSLNLERQADHAVFTVTDNGPGIPPDQLPRLGERFFRASNAASTGSGLGLAIARAVAERHGGKLVIDNARGGGCRAMLLLPFELARN